MSAIAFYDSRVDILSPMRLLFPCTSPVHGKMKDKVFVSPIELERVVVSKSRTKTKLQIFDKNR